MSLQSFSDGQIDVVFPDENNLAIVHVTLKPNDGLYQDGKFDFVVTLPEDYPNRAPTVYCKTKIFHPNISYSGSICFNILGTDWDSSLRLVDYVHALLWLLYQPNLDSRLNTSCPQDTRRFAALVRRSIMGGTVEGENFPCALANPALRPAAPRTKMSPLEGPRTMRDLRAYFEAMTDQPQQQQQQQQQQPTPRPTMSATPTRRWAPVVAPVCYGSVRVY